MAISADLWVQARSLFEIGKTLRDIQAATGINFGSLSRKAKAEGWVKGGMQELVAKNVEVYQNVTDEIQQDIRQNTTSNIQQNIIFNEVEARIKILNSINNIHRGALNVHNEIIKKTMEQIKSGKIGIKEASQILANTGLKVDQIHAVYKPDAPQSATQINIHNGNTVDAPSNESAVDLYKRMIGVN